MTNDRPAMTQDSIDPATHVGLLLLTVSDLERSVDFYTGAIGFSLLHQDGEAVTLGVEGRPLLLLERRPDARPWVQDGHAGLYHLAILVPTRPDLGRWLRHWLELGFPPPGQGDHLVSEALYLQDPEGNGIEIYRDRPRNEWIWDEGYVRMAADPVDMRGLLLDAEQDGAPWTGLADGTRIGHIHLQVGDIAQAAHFYHDVLGFNIVAKMPSALFVSAGGYHHHVGLNTWHSRGAGPTPDDTVGLGLFTISLPSDEALMKVVDRLTSAKISHARTEKGLIVHDPWHNRILVHVGAIDDTAARASARAG